jgi:hypothetical protein
MRARFPGKLTETVERTTAVMIQARPTEWSSFATTRVGIRLGIRDRRQSVMTKNDVDRVNETTRAVSSFGYVRVPDAEEEAHGHAAM